ncbi:hypothetical protein RRG08_027453 [Elysia crispata]|uniref:Uncharacterized protein n=1 Tax=Elysia crispata TaxID=231223 RepID=A0AAE1D357_9GAST|nr:hypothetical protein RRG08_027453 [Elysia crispata]
MEKSCQQSDQNGHLCNPENIENTHTVEMAERPRNNHNERALDDKETTERHTTEAKKKSDRGLGSDPFADPPCGSAGYSQFLRHFPMEATQHDPETHSICFKLPSLPLTRDRNGHAYIADLVYQVAPGIFYHMYCDKSRPTTGKDFWSLDVHKMAAGRACSNIALKTVLKIDSHMYQANARLSSLPVDTQVRQGGRKHFYMAQDFWTADRSHRVMRALSTCLFFDTTSRSAIELPQQLVSSLPTLETDLIPDIWHQHQPAPPTHAFRYSVRVVWGHVDFNGHMGFQWYAQHAIDAILLAVTSQETEAFTTLTTSNMAAGVCSLSVDYLKECCYGDLLDLYAWQDGAQDITAHCWIENKGECSM